jgi:hypothetical protein
MIYGFLKKVLYIFKEEGIKNLIKRIFRYSHYIIKRQLLNDPLNDKKWSLLKNRYNGKRAFLIGNGPSLNRTPLHLLKNEYTFCVNRFNLMFDRIGWLPDMYAISDDLLMSDMIEEINNLKNKVKYIFLPDIHPSAPIKTNYERLIEKVDAIHWIHLDKIGFSNKLPSIGMNKTVTNVALQILVYLGFKEIYLVGVDLDYNNIKSSLNVDDRTLISTKDDDANHFDPRYFSEGRKYHIPRMEETLQKFIEAKRFCEDHGVKVYNATVGGKLEVFPRISFRNLFNISESEEIKIMLDILGQEKTNSDNLCDSLPDSIRISSETNWDNSTKFTIVPLELGFKLVSKYIHTHLPLGPIGSEYIFVKR